MNPMSKHVYSETVAISQPKGFLFFVSEAFILAWVSPHNLRYTLAKISDRFCRSALPGCRSRAAAKVDVQGECNNGDGHVFENKMSCYVIRGRPPPLQPLASVRNASFCVPKQRLSCTCSQAIPIEQSKRVNRYRVLTAFLAACR